MFLKLLVLTSLVLVDNATALDPYSEKYLDDVINNFILRCGDIPGLVLSIVNRTDVLLAKGYGIRNVSSGSPMTADTLLPLGSTTKAFTSALLALLIDKHAKLNTSFNWSTPLKTVFGDWFELHNDVLTTQTTLEDALSHRTGVPDYFMLLISGYPYDTTRQQLIRSLKHHKPQFPFRKEYSYNNHMFVLAGHVAEVIEGRPWEQLVGQYLLNPLGMKSTTFVSDVLKSPPDNMAESCAWHDERCVPVELQLLDQVNIAAPAGAIVSTAHDMSRWMRWHLSGGTVPSDADGTRKSLISKDNLWETYTGRNAAFGRQMKARDIWRQDAGNEIVDDHVTYDLGWMTSYYRGHRRVWHSGSITTYKAQVWLYPDEGYGIFAALAGPMRFDTTSELLHLMHAASDLVLGGPSSPYLPPRDSPCRSDHPYARGANGHVTDDFGDGSERPRPAVDYVGRYVSPEFGHVTITYDELDDVLRMSIGRMFTAALRHYDCLTDEFRADIDGRLWWFADNAVGGWPVRFRSTSTPGGSVDVVELPLQTGPGATAPERRNQFYREGSGRVGDWPAGTVGNSTCGSPNAEASSSSTGDRLTAAGPFGLCVVMALWVRV